MEDNEKKIIDELENNEDQEDEKKDEEIVVEEKEEPVIPKVRKQSEDSTVQFNDKKEDANKETVKRASGHKAAFPVGIIVTILALVGIVSIIYFSATGIKSAVDKNKNFDEYNEMLAPVVLMDPYTFDDITKSDMNDLLEISVWSLLKNNLTPEKYVSDDKGLVIPKTDVEAEFVKLFGTEIAPAHSSIIGYGYEFTYDSNSEKYSVPLTGIMPIYTPKVVDVNKSSDKTVLKVACFSAEAWQQGADGKMIEPTPDKFLKITLREKDGFKFISSIQNTATPEAVTDETIPETVTENKDLIEQAEQIAAEASSTTVAETTTEETTVETEE